MFRMRGEIAKAAAAETAGILGQIVEGGSAGKRVAEAALNKFANQDGLRFLFGIRPMGQAGRDGDRNLERDRCHGSMVSPDRQRGNTLVGEVEGGDGAGDAFDVGEEGGN